MANLNRIILVGRLVADPEARATLNGIPVAKFRLAVNRPQGTGTDFIDVVAWRKIAEFCGDLLRKGQLILVEGSIQVRSFEDQTGQRRWTTEVVAKSVQLMEKGAAAATRSTGESRPAAEAPAALGASLSEDDETVEDAEWGNDLPF